MSRPPPISRERGQIRRVNTKKFKGKKRTGGEHGETSETDEQTEGEEPRTTSTTIIGKPRACHIQFVPALIIM